MVRESPVDGEREDASGRRWAIAAPHARATAAGEAAFRAGGNAIDAALAAAATLTVVYPHNCALGGDLIALVATPDGRHTVVNGSGGAARTADADDLRRLGPSMPVRGPHPVTVPGAVAAWETLHALGARRPLARALDWAIEAAENGVPVAGSLAAALIEEAELLRQNEGMRGVFFDSEGPLRLGAPLLQPALARSLRAIAADGAASLYRGPLGRRVIATLRTLGSSLGVEDLRIHATEITSPLSGRFGELEVLTAPPNSQGFVLLEILAAIDALDGEPDLLTHDAPLLAEIARLAANDRDRYLGDPRQTSVSVAELFAEARAAQLAAAARGRIEAPGQPTAATCPSSRPSGDTVAVVAVDADGYAVSLIQSIFYSFGSGILDPATGIICHNRGASFSLDPGSPNVLAPGKRPLHTLMPVLVRRRGKLTAVPGTMGGQAQPQIHAQLLLHLLAGASPAEAVGAPRFIVEGDVVLAEGLVAEAACSALVSTGFPITALADRDEEVGHAQLIACNSDGTFSAASDPRCDGAAAAG